MKSRLPQFDILRVAAALAVIAIHVTAAYVGELPLAYLWNHAVRFAVPLFIVLSGFLLNYTDGRDAKGTALVFYLKRLDKILWPYIIWTFFYSCLNAYILGQTNLLLFFSTLGKDLLWGTGYYHLWFLPIILQLYLLYPLLRRWVEKGPLVLLIGSLVISLTAQSLIYLYMIHIVSLPGQYSLMYVRAFPVWLFYFVFGMFMAMRSKGKCQGDGLFASLSQTPNKGSKNTVSLTLLWLSSLGLMLLDSKLTVQGSIVRPSVMLYAICSFFFFYALAFRLRQKERPWLAWLSAQSFLIYLMHPLLLTILVYASIKIGHPGLWAGTRGLLGLYFFTTVCTIMGTYGVSLTPLASLLGGNKKAQK
jgi:surface polysaccharide O-acyltransferase-like enzyme